MVLARPFLFTPIGDFVTPSRTRCDMALDTNLDGFDPKNLPFSHLTEEGLKYIQSSLEFIFIILIKLQFLIEIPNINVS